MNLASSQHADLQDALHANAPGTLASIMTVSLSELMIASPSSVGAREASSESSSIDASSSTGTTEASSRPSSIGAAPSPASIRAGPASPPSVMAESPSASRASFRRASKRSTALSTLCLTLSDAFVTGCLPSSVGGGVAVSRRTRCFSAKASVRAFMSSSNAVSSNLARRFGRFGRLARGFGRLTPRSKSSSSLSSSARTRSFSLAFSDVSSQGSNWIAFPLTFEMDTSDFLKDWNFFVMRMSEHRSLAARYWRSNVPREQWSMPLLNAPMSATV
mmetsp:Transcript_28374/g.93977  ORF Transcript_28374/g.93977 Transcript_28374/m.93977 type:complete len:275 (-) Transcript_28374:318-1142(-)